MMNELKLPGNLVSAEWLHQNLSNDKLCVLDASWHLASKERNGKEEWSHSRIPGAGFFDYDDEIKDQDTELPRMLPGEELFAESVRKLGVNSDSLIVVYDTNSMFSSPRAWWMFRAMSHDQVAVLDGGMLAWQEAGYSIDSDPANPVSTGNFSAEKNECFINAAYVQSHLTDIGTTILDARSNDRFASGHMPGAKNLPYLELLQDGKMKSVEELKNIFSSKIDKQQDLVCSCGSGVTACIIALGAELAGHDNIVVYDGSWTEWGAEGSGFPIEAND